MGGRGGAVSTGLPPSRMLDVSLRFRRRDTMFRKHLRFRRRFFVGLAFAALAAPTAAQAQTGLLVDGGPAPVSRVSSYVVPARSEHSASVGATELQRFFA